MYNMQLHYDNRIMSNAFKTGNIMGTRPSFLFSCVFSNFLIEEVSFKLLNVYRMFQS